MIAAFPGHTRLLIFPYPSILTYVLGAQKNRLIETVLSSTHNICFGLRNKKKNWYTLLLSCGCLF